MSKPQEPRAFGRISKPGRLYACYELRMGYTTELKVKAAYMALHKAEPAEVVWAKPGFWLAGPVPEPAYLVGIEERPAALVDFETGRTEHVEGNEQEDFFWENQEAEHRDNPYYDYDHGEPDPQIETTPTAVKQLGLF